MSFGEWEKVFKRFGRNLFWVTLSGGEPFIRNDLRELAYSLYDHCRPRIINIPTNGLLKKRIPPVVEQIAAHCNRAQIVVNLSIDEIGEKHDDIRGVRGNYKKALETFLALKSLDLTNLSVGIHTVISKFNVHRISHIYRHIKAQRPDSYITEIAEEREELATIGADITPEYESYADAVDSLIKELKKSKFHRLGKITRAFRIRYYQIAKQILLEKRQVIPCYSGFASAQIAPDGDVWVCCIQAKPIGNLRDVDYDFKEIWLSKKAETLRMSVKRGECYCPLANASYTNMLHNLKSLLGVVWNLLRMS